MQPSGKDGIFLKSPDRHWIVIIFIFTGGALGTLLRYTINVQTSLLLFPWGTLLENLAGSLLLGFLTGYILKRTIQPHFKEGIGVGFCGGFTTMSTLAADTVFLAETGSAASTMVYIFSSMFGGMFLALAGMTLGSLAARRGIKEKGEGQR